MRYNSFYQHLHRQIPVLMLLSATGLGYVGLGWFYGITLPALVWFGLIILADIWGYRLYRQFSLEEMGSEQRERWYRHTRSFYYVFMLMWSAIFIIYVRYPEYNFHYIAVFTQIGTTVVASTLLFPDKRLYNPIIAVSMTMLVIYFAAIGEWYTYVLTVFSIVLGWVLWYAANSSNRLLEQTNYQATHDSLTGLKNRHFFIEFLQTKMNGLSQSGGFSYLLLIDLDHFKTVNDSLGHDIGDKLLVEVTNRFHNEVPSQCQIARLGGDEFIITGPDFDERDKCRLETLKLADKLNLAIKAPYSIDRHHIHISASIGASLISSSNHNAVDFIKEADIAMYEVKEKGRDGVFFFDEEMSRRVEENLTIEQRLHFAIENDEIELHFQPQLDAEGQILGVESLARWTSPLLGEVPTWKFIQVAEHTGLIVEQGGCILESAFKTLSDWTRQGIELKQFSINISMRHFMHYNFVREVESLYKHYLDEQMASRVIFELTESVVAEDIQQVIAIMQAIKKLGIRFSIDDFGTGYSSLSYIKQLPFDEIKIDRTFIMDIGQDPAAQQMISTILNIADIFKLNVVAEGVETQDQCDFLLRHNCHIMQGYFFARPMAREAFEALYRERPILGLESS